MYTDKKSSTNVTNINMHNITQFQRVVLPSVYLCQWMFYYIHQRDMDAPHCVHNDVLADVLLSWKSHFTHHGNMDASNYVHSDAISDVLLAWMSHYTHHSGMEPMH
jgi:hypothetical protein